MLEPVQIKLIVEGSVTCNHPCVPECTREHPWEPTE